MLEKKLQILEEIFGDYNRIHQRKGEEYLFYCPKCKHHKKKLSFDIDKNYFKCWVCLWAGKSILWAIVAFGNGRQIAHWNELSDNIDFASLKNVVELEEQQVSLPEEFISIATHKPTPLTMNARLYLKERGLAFQDIVWWKMGVCLEGKYKNRIIIPSFDMTGKCNYFVARAFDVHPVPYLNPPMSKDILFNELYLDWNKDITLTEGVFDAIVAGNSIPLLGSTLNENSYIFRRIVEKCENIFICLDPDAYEKEVKIINNLLLYGVKIQKIEIKPYKDVGSMSRESFLKQKQNSIEVSKFNEIEFRLRQ